MSHMNIVLVDGIYCRLIFSILPNHIAQKKLKIAILIFQQDDLYQNYDWNHTQQKLVLSRIQGR